MTSRTRNKSIALLLNILSFVIMLGIPFMIIIEKFPSWKRAGGLLSACGFGAFIMAFIAFLIFKKYVIAWATEKLGVISAGVSLIFVFGGLSAVFIVLSLSATLLNDLTTVFIWSTIGAVIGVILQIIARRLKKKVSDHEEN